MNRIVSALQEFSGIRQSLMIEAPAESAAIFLCEPVSTPQGTRLLVDSIVRPGAADYSIQEALRLELKPTFVAKVLKNARDHRKSLIFIHSHPFAKGAHFSEIDLAGEEQLAPTLFQRAPGRPHGWLVMSPDGFSGRIRLAAEDIKPIDRLARVGTTLQLEMRSSRIDLDSHYDRTVRALGE